MQIDWLKFPALEQAFAEGAEKSIQHSESEQKRYSALAETGTAGERARARLVAASYAHAARLLREIEKAQKPAADKVQRSGAQLR